MNAVAGRRTSEGLLQRLMAVVRPEFRAEVFHAPPGATVFAPGQCRVAACPALASRRELGLCDRHHRLWRRAGRPELDAWTAGHDDLRRLQQRRLNPQCAVDGCRRAAGSRGLCQRHRYLWTGAGRPELSEWVASVIYQPPPDGERSCRFPGCPRWADGPLGLCCQHGDMRRYRIRTLGPITVDEWLASPVWPPREQRVDLRGLGRQIRLEVQYGLQHRHDEGRQPTPLRAVTTVVGILRRSGVHSLLDWDAEQWRRYRRQASPRDKSSQVTSFLLDVHFQLERLRLGDDPWTGQWPEPVWDLRKVGIIDQNVRYLRFGGIRQPWLAELCKRWCRWRLTRGGAPSTTAAHLRACIDFTRSLPADATPGQVTRARVEAWCAILAGRYPQPSTRAGYICGLGVFLKDVHRHGWQPDLARDAFVYDDAPRVAPARPRWIPEPVMRQLENPANLAQFPTDDGRTVLRILIGCGLRLKDATHLPFDCVVRDNDAAPYLAWINHKIGNRAAFFPLTEPLAEAIAAQQERVRHRFPDGCRWLFPSDTKNLNGATPMPRASWRNLLEAWLNRIHLTDTHGRPTTITAHQFRHTLGTRLINADVPQHVVQQLLDHMSPEMTGVYARLLDTTVRQHWQKAIQITGDGTVTPLADDHPLAEATWIRLSMVRAKVILPNGYCDTPIHSDCEYANPCLDCRFFITTTDFLDQHRRQRAETVRLIGDAEQAGLARIAERNRRTLGKLDTIIDALATADPGQIVVGATPEAIDDAS